MRFECGLLAINANTKSYMQQGIENGISDGGSRNRREVIFNEYSFIITYLKFWIYLIAKAN